MKIKIITNCPSCNSKLVDVNGVLYCRNTECPAKLSKLLLHHAKAVGLKGFGQKAIETIAEKVESLKEFWSLDKSFFLSLRNGKNLYKEFERVKTEGVDAQDYIASLGIKGIGKVKALNLLPLSYEELSNSYGQEYADLIKNPLIPIVKNESVTELKGSVVLTGRFPQGKSQMERELKSKGYDIKSAVSGKTSYLIVGEHNQVSSKHSKAKSLGITIVNYNQVKEIL